MPFTYQWTRDGKDIPGAVGDTYQATNADKGHTIYFRTVGSGAGGSTAATSPGVFIPAAGPVLAISGTPPSSAVVGVAYSFTPSTTGGTAPYTYSIPTGSLPAGLSLNATTGAITGTPTTAQVKTGIVLMVTDHVGATASLPAFSITVGSAGQSVTPSTWYAALQAATPGTILTMAQGDYGTMGVYGANHAAPGVTLQGQPGVIASGGVEITASGVNFVGVTVTGLYANNYGIIVHDCDRVTVDRCTLPGNNPGGLHNGVGIFGRNATNLAITNNTIQNMGDGIDGADCTNLTISGNHITKYSANAIFWQSIHTATIEKNYIANIDYLDPGTHPDTIQISSTGSSGRSSNVIIRYNNYDAMNGAAAQGIAFCESVDTLTITGNCSFGCMTNGTAFSDSTNVTVTDNFDQGWAYGPVIIGRGASNIITMSGNSCPTTPFTIENCTNVTIGPNTLIPNATSSSDTALRNAWLTSHPLVPTS